MPVDGLKVVGVTEYDVVPIAAPLIFGQPDASVKRCAYGVAGVGLEVDAFVHTPETAAVPVG